MKRIFAIVIFGLSSILVGCGSDDGKYAGTWDSVDGLSRYILISQDDGYKVQYQRKVSNGEMINGRQMFFKKTGSYLSLESNPHFLEILSDKELKSTSSNMIFSKSK